MKHIEKITINNARRFGGNIEVDFGSGATIILAPNGTGKTTIFEAIELALTGGIKRIENFPDAIIRNGLSEMNVRLDFLEGKFCQTNYTKGGDCIQNGDYKELFLTENNLSVPYLFRLTHFLEQRGKGWFVEQNDKEAGNFLSQLPIGKDLQNIVSKRTSLLKAIGATETRTGNALTQAQMELSKFEELIVKRNGLATVATLTSLEEIVAKLHAISGLFNYEEYNEEHNIILINNYFEKLRIALNQENNRKKDLVIRLSTLKERALLYVLNLESLSQKQTISLEYSKKIAELTPIIELSKKEIQDAKGSLSCIKDEIKKLNSVKFMFEEVERKSAHLVAIKAELEQNDKTLGELKKSNEGTIKYLKKYERLRDQYKLADEAIENRENYLTQTKQKSDFQKEWQNLSKINQDYLENILPEIEKKKCEYLATKIRFDNDVSEVEKVYSTKKNALESLNKASGAIQDAVSSIRKHIAENQSYCPVCQANYEPGDLIKRIEESLNTLNPALPLAIIEEKKALEALELAKEKQTKENQKILDIESEANVEHEKLETNKKRISERLLPQFPGIKTPEEANTYIEEQIFQIAAEIIKLKSNRSQLEPEVTVGEIDNANLRKKEDERTINELNSKNENLRNQVSSEIVAFESIKEESLLGNDKETILANLSKKLIEEVKKTKFIIEMEATLNTNEAELKKNKTSFFSENEAASKIKSSQEGICTEWSQAGLEGLPNQETLKLRHEAISKSIDELDNANSNLNIIEQEFASWRTAEKFNDVDNEVKKQIGDSSEEAYIESLNTTVDKNKSTLSNIQEKKKAVNLFLSNVASESEHINEQLNSINEPWKKLLKRIVINPLISSAPLLSNTTLRNQPIAKTSALIHKQNIAIADIASEAQLTDLQLTLMLSMANKYKWTPWKALLLDDPTQHHDLVHASSVFDVLRDYIIDLDYQVMMSTHDSIQANFFQRKLENEGVPCKIYQLIARTGGVTADRMS